MLARLLPRPLFRKLLLNRLRFDDSKLADVEIYIAESKPDIEAALALTHAVYVAQGKIKPCAGGLYLTAHNALPSTIVFVAKTGGRVIATCSLVPDSPRGLPLDVLQRPALDELRAAGLRLCESSGAVCDMEYRGTGLAFYLYRSMVHAARRAKFDRIVLSAQPKGLKIYEQLLACEQLGKPAHHPSFNNAKPSGALQCDLRICEGRTYERYHGLAPYERTPHFIMYGKHVPQIRLPADLSISPERAAASAALLLADQRRPDARIQPACTASP